MSNSLRSRFRLTAKEVEGAALPPGKTTKKLSDGAGLTLVIRAGTNGSGKYWQQRFNDPVTGKEQVASLGVYPEVNLSAARRKAQSVREDLANGITPKDRERIELKKLNRSRRAAERTFESVSRDWWRESIEDGIWSSEEHQRTVIRTLELHAFPELGSVPINEISPADVRTVVRKVGQSGAWEMATRTLQRMNSVFAYALDLGLVERVPTDAARRWLQGARPEEVKGRNYPHLLPHELPELAQAIEEEQEFMDPVTYLGLHAQALTFVRPGELRHARWTDFKWEERIWVIPPKFMKQNREHLVPLSHPMLELLSKLKPLTGNRTWLFPGRTKPRVPMSDGTIAMAIKRLRPDKNGIGAFSGRHTAHSFRHTASTYLNDYEEKGHYPFRGDPVELQLAHLDRNMVRRRYNKSTMLPLRRQMMETWGNFWMQCQALDHQSVAMHKVLNHV